jgi:hypothetical protein
MTDSTDDDNIVKLNVGGKSFEVYESTIENSDSLYNFLFYDGSEESAYFNRNEELFIDRDKDMFAHILQWVRKGKINIQDQTTLLDLRDEAEYFAMDDLKEEINIKLNNIHNSTVHYSLLDPEELEGLSQISALVPTKQTTTGIDKNHRLITSINYTEKIWRCPRNIPVHMQPEHCGKKCYNSMLCEHNGWVYEKRTKYLVAKYT